MLKIEKIGDRYAVIRMSNEFTTFLDPIPETRAIAEKIMRKTEDTVERLRLITEWVHDNIAYEPDWLDYGKPDFFASPRETLKRGAGDCLTGDTEIIVVDEDNKYTIMKLKELKNNWKGKKVLTYNFKEHKWVLKKITNFYDRGIRDVYEVTLYNGRKFRVADMHKMYVLKYIAKNRRRILEVMYFKDLREKWMKIKNKHYYTLPIVKSIPALGTVDIPEEQAYIEGLYAAEGWSDDYHVNLSGKKIEVLIKTIEYLNRLGIEYSIRQNKNGTYIICIHKSDLKNILKNMGRTSKDKQFIDSRLSMSNQKLYSLIEGYIDGDGYRNPKRTKTDGKRDRSVEVIYNTISENLMKQLLMVNRILGKYTYTWYQVNHQGLGKNPIWRLYTYKDTEYIIKRLYDKNIISVGIKSIEYQGKERVYDISVEDTHNFVLADSGVIVHNCEDMSFLICSIANALKPKPTPVYVTVGYYTGLGMPTSYHAWAYCGGAVCEGTAGFITSKDDKRYHPIFGIYRDHISIFKPVSYFVSKSGLLNIDIGEIISQPIVAYMAASVAAPLVAKGVEKGIELLEKKKR